MKKKKNWYVYLKAIPDVINNDHEKIEGLPPREYIHYKKKKKKKKKKFTDTLNKMFRE